PARLQLTPGYPHASNRRSASAILLPYTTLFRSLFADKPLHKQFVEISKPLHTGEIMGLPSAILYFIVALIGCMLPITGFIIWWKDRKSTRLNSSHVKSSYAGFCLKKKTRLRSRT